MPRRNHARQSASSLDGAALQHRTVRVLFGGVLPAGAGTTAAFSSAALLGKEITDNGFLGTLAAACVTVGGAIATVPIANHMAHHGRRPGLRTGWLIAMMGSVLA